MLFRSHQNKPTKMASFVSFLVLLLAALILMPQGLATYYKPIKKPPVYKPPVYKPPVYKPPVYKPKPPVYKPKPPVYKPPYKKPPYKKPPYGKYPPVEDNTHA